MAAGFAYWFCAASGAASRRNRAGAKVDLDGIGRRGGLPFRDGISRSEGARSTVPRLLNGALAGPCGFQAYQGEREARKKPPNGARFHAE